MLYNIALGGSIAGTALILLVSEPNWRLTTMIWNGVAFILWYLLLKKENTNDDKN